MARENRARRAPVPDTRQTGKSPALDQSMPPRKAPATRPSLVRAKKADMVEARSSGLAPIQGQRDK